jgi:hypothetical protein
VGHLYALQVLFGCPQNGADLQAWELLMYKIVVASTTPSTAEVARSLLQQSPEQLIAISTAFYSIASGYKVVSCYEGAGAQLLGAVVCFHRICRYKHTYKILYRQSTKNPRHYRLLPKNKFLLKEHTLDFAKLAPKQAAS